MKKVLISLIAAATVVALPGAASAGPQPVAYFVAKFDGSPGTKLAFSATGAQVSDIAVKTRIPCSRGAGTLTAFLDPAPLVEGRFSSVAKAPVLQEGNLIRVRGRDVPGSPVGKLRIRTKTRKKTCGATKEWSATEVSKTRWDKYRDKAFTVF